MKFSLRYTSAPRARSRVEEFQHLYHSHPLDEADVVVVLGGDGFMLETLHEVMGRDLPVYGMNLGTVGFLLNEYSATRLEERIQDAHQATVTPLRMNVWDTRGDLLGSSLAVNDVSVVRSGTQTAHLRVLVDGTERLAELVGDGALVSTSAGSSAYNLSAGGPVLPLGSQVLALTPICAAHPRRWPGALLHHESVTRIEVLDPEKRPVTATADNARYEDVGAVEIFEETTSSLVLLFDPGHDLEERILRQQFPTT